jgi:lipopolysaccharide transport system ATP-binding protein
MGELLKEAEILVIASHSEDTILRYCDRVIWLDHGKVKLDSTPEIVVKAYFNGED